MNGNPKLSYAIAAILSGSAAGFAYATPASDAEAASDQIQEITVTAQRRTENNQNVPIQIQALTAETLVQLNVSTFEDFVRYLPNVQDASQGPGQGNIYMRGLGTTSDGTQGAGGVGQFPNVAVYLDDQSAQLPGRNLDIYAADLERIEVLEGPQGTLFGAGAQAGVLRYITNKPKLDVTEGNVNAGYETTAHGTPSAYLDATLNLPLIADTLAVRAVIYSDSRGGYINNIPATFTRSDADRGIIAYEGGVVPPGSPSINNAALVGDAINPLTYKGFRFSGLLKFNDDWNALLTQSYQSMDAEGVFAEQLVDFNLQPLPDLSTEQYNPSYDKDRFENTALTINGGIDELKLVYTGGYLVRNVDQLTDYTNYARGKYADYYQCISPGGPFTPGYVPTNVYPQGKCYSPSATWRDHENNTHDRQEVRLSTPDDWRVRGIGGLFWEDYTIHEQTDWFYETNPNFYPIAPPTTPPVTSNNPNVRPAGDSFFDDITRGYKQKAVFGSFDVDFIPKTLTFTAGTRYYSIDTFEVGSAVGSFGCQPGGLYAAATVPNPCVNVSNITNLNADNLNKTYTGFKSRLNLSWHVTEDALLYYTWSQGFRPGGFNRGTAEISPSSPLYGIFKQPISFSPDTLINNELGWKTEWFDHRFLFNGAVYQEDWKNAQISIFDPGVTGNLTFTTNGPDYRVRGLEIETVARITHGLTLTAAASWNTSELTNAPSLVGLNGQPITIANPYGAQGTPLAESPPFQGNLRARYEFTVNDYKAFWQIGGKHQAHSYATTDRLTTEVNPVTPGAPGASIAYDMPGYSTYDGSLGIGKDAWSAELYGQNLTDARAITYESYSEFVRNATIIRPRTLGLKFHYKF